MKSPLEASENARKGRSRAIAFSIAALMALFFFITIAKYVGR